MLPPQIDEALIQEWKEHDKERYAALMTPESALKTSIGLLNREAYTIRRVSEEIPVYVGVDIDFAIKFPDFDPLFLLRCMVNKPKRATPFGRLGVFGAENQIIRFEDKNAGQHRPAFFIANLQKIQCIYRQFA